MKIFLDTDIATDSDDAICLSYLLLREDCDLAGVTTCGPDSRLRAAVARKLCTHFGRPDVPVAAGADTPFLLSPFWWGHRVNQHVILDEPPAPEPARPLEAVELMAKTLRAHPGEVTLLTVGPLSNVGLLVKTDPDAARMAKAVYSMIGRMRPPPGQPHAECNTMLDPAPACAVFAAELPAHTVVPLDATGRMGLSDDEMRAIFDGDRLRILRRCCEAWIERKGKPGTGLHDPLTAACIFDPTFCTYEQGRVGVQLIDHNDRTGETLEAGQWNGHTVFVEEPNGPHRVAFDRDRERYLRHLDEAFAAAR